MQKESLKAKQNKQKNILPHNAEKMFKEGKRKKFLYILLLTFTNYFLMTLQQAKFKLKFTSVNLINVIMLIITLKVEQRHFHKRNILSYSFTKFPPNWLSWICSLCRVADINILQTSCLYRVFFIVRCWNRGEHRLSPKSVFLKLCKRHNHLEALLKPRSLLHPGYHQQMNG